MNGILSLKRRFLFNVLDVNQGIGKMESETGTQEEEEIRKFLPKAIIVLKELVGDEEKSY